MAEHEERPENIVDRIIDDSHSSSSDSDEFKAVDDQRSSITKDNVRKLFGRERPLHVILGGGKAAEIVLWRNKCASAKVLGAVTLLWFLFEVLGYHLITLACHALILTIIISFLWTKASVFIRKSTPCIPQVIIPRDCVTEVVSSLGNEVFGLLDALHDLLKDVAQGKDIKKFIGAIVALWILSIIGSSFSFISLLYLCIVFMFTVPMVYEKNEEMADKYGEIIVAEMKKQYAVFDKKVLSQIPILSGSSKKD